MLYFLIKSLFYIFGGFMHIDSKFSTYQDFVMEP